MSRPTKYRNEYVEILRELIEDPKHSFGTYREIAEYLGVSVQSVRNWCSLYPDFSQAVKDFQDVGTEYAEEAVHRLANGCYVKTTTTKNNGDVITEVKELPPNFPAVKFILMNRRPDLWKDSFDLTSNGKSIQPILVFSDDLSTEERFRIEHDQRGKIVCQFDEQDAGLL